jgi:Holliday junction resolvase RusA-like endonuclease
MHTEQLLAASFVVEGEPKGEPRPRARRLGNHATVYPAKTADAWKYAVRGALVDQMDYRNWPVFGPKEPVAVWITFLMPRPKSHYVASDPTRNLKASAPYYCLSKPDLDNLEKSTLDALGEWPKGAQGLLWFDDRQVVALETRKVYTPHGESPGAKITARSIPPTPDPF